MFNNNRGSNIFNNNNTNNLFGANRNNTTPNNGTNNIFGQNNNNNTNTGIFGQNNNNNNNTMGQQGTGMFNNTNTGNNIFGNNMNNNNNNNNTPFGQNNNNNAPLFNQNNNTPQPQTGMFANNNPNQNTLFNQNNQNNQNMFNQNRPNNNFFPNNQNNPNNFPQPMVGANPPFGHNPITNFNLMTLQPDQQQRVIKEMTNDQIRKYIDHCLKSLIDVKKLDLLTIGNDNQLRNQKMNKTANTYNIKKEVLYVKKEVNDKLVTPLKNLKNKDKEIFNASAELAYKVAEKLQKYKEKLIEAISEKKMIEDIKRQIDDIDNQIKEFLKPLFNSHQTRNSFSFIDPDQFCIRVSQQILKNIAYLDNKMDQLLACEGEAPQQVVDTGDVIQMLVEYYQNVVISLREYSEKYHKQKKEVLSKRRMGNTDQTMRRIMEKANVSVGKELKAYELVKEIESVLLQREKRMSQQMSLQ